MIVAFLSEKLVIVEGLVAPSAKLAQIPLIDMHYEAVKAGVPLKSWNEISGDEELTDQFQCHPLLIRDYNDWLSNHGVIDRNHDEQIKAHTRQYVKWKGTLIRKGNLHLAHQQFYLRAQDKERKQLLNANKALEKLIDKFTKKEEEIRERNKEREAQNDRNDANRALYDKRYAELRARGVDIPYHPPLIVRYAPIPLEAMLRTDTKELYDAARDETPLAACTKKLFENYVHDSLAHFDLLWGWTEFDFFLISTDGYLRYRTTFKMTSTLVATQCTPEGYPYISVPSLPEAFQQMGNAMGR